jgi:hypothetical protein
LQVWLWEEDKEYYKDLAGNYMDRFQQADREQHAIAN